MVPSGAYPFLAIILILYEVNFRSRLFISLLLKGSRTIVKWWMVWKQSAKITTLMIWTSFIEGCFKGYWSLELFFLDKILANQGFEDIIEISQFVDLAFSFREKCVKTFLYAHTPCHISSTSGPKPKW